MNHSSFIDLKMATTIWYPKPLNIVCTSDGFVGKEWLMRHLGCIPTKKFITDATLVKDMIYALKTLKSSVLMFPEAGYSFDGTPTRLPDTMGKMLKLLKVPFVMIKTYGAFLHDPLYNDLKLRKVDVSADVEYVLSAEEINEKSVDELNNIVKEKFTFDNFRWQQENNVKITEEFRADNLNRVLYKCPHCLGENCTIGKGITIKCNSCGAEYELTENGSLKCLTGEGKFNHIPDWFKWERECVKEEILSNKYSLETDVNICVLKDTKCLYDVGDGHLSHNEKGFHLTGSGIDYTQPAASSYELNADYYWYEIGDIISIGTSDLMYYCFPKNKEDIVAKTRFAVEVLYDISKEK